jgi:hypothetical protein
MEELEQMKRRAESYQRLVKILMDRLQRDKLPLSESEILMVFQIMVEVTSFQVELIKHGIVGGKQE